MALKIVHTYIKNMSIDVTKPHKFTFADRWGLVSQAEEGHDVTLICGGSGKARKEYFFKGIRIIELPVLFQITTSTRILKGLIKELVAIDAEVFHTHHYCSFLPEITAIIGKIRNIPVFVTMHSSFHGQSGFAGLAEYLYSVIMRLFLPLYSKVFLISKFYMNINKFYSKIPNHKKELLYNHFATPAKMKVKRRENNILAVGRLTHIKGADIILRALPLIRKEIPDVRFNIIGEGDDEKYKEIIHKLARELKIENNVKFWGEVFGEKKWNHYYENTVLVVPHRDSGFGNVAVEGLLCKIPVLTSNKYNLPEGFAGKENLFDINDIEDVSRKIVNVLKNKKLQKELAESIGNKAKVFTDNTISRKTISTYKKFIRK